MSVAWTVVTTTMLKDYLVAAQMTALQTAALSGGTDPFLTIMPDVAARIRAAVASCAKNTISETANSVPPELKWVACILIIELMQTRLPSMTLSDSQKKTAEDAKKTLAEVAKCELAVSTPTDPGGETLYQTGPPLELVSYSTRVCSRANLAGL